MAATTIDPGVKVIVAQVSALVQLFVDRQRAAGRSATELAQDRAALVAGITESLARKQS